MGTRLAASTLSLLTAHQNELSALAASLRFASPLRRIQTDRQRVDDFARRGRSALRHRLALDRSRLGGFERRFRSLNPLAVLGRGYAIVTRTEDGNLVSEVDQVEPGNGLQIRVSDGSFGAIVSKEEES
jgi:exodeoxyribonuclease VII large subunit